MDTDKSPLLRRELGDFFLRQRQLTNTPNRNRFGNPKKLIRLKGYIIDVNFYRSWQMAKKQPQNVTMRVRIGESEIEVTGPT